MTFGLKGELLRKCSKESKGKKPPNNYQEMNVAKDIKGNKKGVYNRYKEQTKEAAGLLFNSEVELLPKDAKKHSCSMTTLPQSLQQK